MTDAGDSSTGAVGGVGPQSGAQAQAARDEEEVSGSERKKTGRKAGTVRGRRAGDRHAHSPQTRGRWGTPARHDLPAKGSQAGLLGSERQGSATLPSVETCAASDLQGACASAAVASTWPGALHRLQLPECGANPLPPPGKQVTSGILPWVGQSRETQAGAVCSISFLEGQQVKGLAMASLIRKVISTAKAPGAIGPYSQAVLVDRTIYISGQIGMDPASGQLVPGGVAEEAKQALTNMGEILKAAGCDFTNVVKTTVLLADINDFNTVNEVYKQYFRSSFPARAAYQVAALPKGSRVEIEAVAVQGPLTTASL